MTTTDDILQLLSKDTKSKILKASDVSEEILPTASYGLNKAIGGGLRLGKQHTFWGGEGTGKSAFILQTVGINQARGVPCAWIDAENVFDPTWATRLGVDTNNLILAKQPTISDLTDLQIDLIKSGVGLIVIDSTGALWPKSFVDKTGGVKAFEDTAQLGQMAKDLGQMCKMVQGINYTCAVVHISQQRVDVGSPAMNKPYKPIGGKEVEHADSLRVRLTSPKSDDKQKKLKIHRGNVLMEVNVGFPVTWIINKNRINGVQEAGDYDFYRVSNPGFSGVDYSGELVDAAVSYGVIDKTGAWFNYNGEKWQGRDAAVARFRDDEEIREKVRAELDAF